MATRTKKAKEDVGRDPKGALYASLGAGQVVVEATKGFVAKSVDLVRNRREVLSKTYGELATRGQKLVAGIRDSAYTQRAVQQSRTARTRVKAAATSVRKAAGTTAEASKEAAKKVG